MQQISDTVTRIVGRAYVGNVSSAGKVQAGLGAQNCLALAFDINPVLLNDRVSVIATTFEKYVYQGVKFTYVPQCPTSIGGSVGLVFDRDPLTISADTQSTQFLAQVMSYEHAVLTPAYVPACTSYSRDPKELKTWFIGGTDATITTRETSQGNLLVYISNAYSAQTGTNAFNGGYGYIIMDYVLDLVAPTLMPNRQVANNINKAPGQWLDLNGNVPGSNATSFTLGSALFLPPTNVGGSELPFTLVPNSAWVSALDGSVAGTAYAPGLVGEIHLGYNIIGTATGPPATTGTTGLPQGFFTVGGSAVTFKAGQKLYFCVHEVVATATNATTSAQMVVTVHLSLGSARAAASLAYTQSASEIVACPDVLLVAPGSSPSISGWTRAIAPGSAVSIQN